MDALLAAKSASALSDRYRLNIVLALSQQESMPFADVQQLTGLSQPCVSHHLKILTDSGLVRTRKCGRCLSLTLNREAMGQFASFLVNLR
ncbi:metalloregulator ArsR/SmtB family transcription factor [Hymenobacter sp.]|jgi:DNA-binding transcriptional ArsR family regulator|uniref:ArsR/SmtB family transcription factor n=1 Tax=Hymenobacter sp. TaxID=1898978 RepID=UPI002ED8808D